MSDQRLHSNHSIESLASRIGSFPLSLALEEITKHCDVSAIIHDPFCGKGTTVTASRLLRKQIIASDASPEATTLAEAKLTNLSLDVVKKYIRGIKLRKEETTTVDPRVKIYFHTETLSQILSVQKTLEKDIGSERSTTRACAKLTRGLILGILHGHSNNSLSVRSSHSISFSPNYVKDYCQKHGLTAPNRDIKECLLAQAEKILADRLEKSIGSQVKCAKAEATTKTFKKFVGTVDLILTSPPYLNKQTYAKDNWLRLWFLGFDYKDIKRKLIETADLNTYERQMLACLGEMQEMLKPGGKLIFITGTVRKSLQRKNERIYQEINLGNEIVKIASTLPQLSLLSFDSHEVKNHKRYFHALKNSSGHSGYARHEQILTFEKS